MSDEELLKSPSIYQRVEDVLPPQEQQHAEAIAKQQQDDRAAAQQSSRCKCATRCARASPRRGCSQDAGASSSGTQASGSRLPSARLPPLRAIQCWPSRP